MLKLMIKMRVRCFGFSVLSLILAKKNPIYAQTQPSSSTRWRKIKRQRF